MLQPCSSNAKCHWAPSQLQKREEQGPHLLLFRRPHRHYLHLEKKFAKYIEKMKLFQDDNLVLLNYHIDKNLSQFDAEHSQRWNTACPSPSTQNVLEVFLSPGWVAHHGVFKHPVDLQLLSLKLIFVLISSKLIWKFPKKKKSTTSFGPKMNFLNLLERKTLHNWIHMPNPALSISNASCSSHQGEMGMKAASTE